MEGKNTGLRFYRWKDEVIAAGLLLAFAFFVNREIRIAGLFMDDLYLWSCFGEQSFAEFVFPLGSTRFRFLYYLAAYLELAFVGSHVTWFVPINILLNGAIAYTVFRFGRRLSGNTILGFACGFLYLLSRMSCYQIAQVYGLMESLALWAAIGILYCLYQFINEPGRQYRYYGLACGLYFAVCFIHERYMVLLPLLFLALLFKKEKKVWNWLLPLALFGAVQLIRFFTIGTVSPAGTGGTDVADTVSLSSVLHFMTQQVLYLMGINTGEAYLSGCAWQDTPRYVKLLTAGADLALLFLTAAFVIRLFLDKRGRRTYLKNSLLFVGFIGGCILCSSVTIRVELRWVYVSMTGCWLYLAYMCGVIVKKTQKEEEQSSSSFAPVYSRALACIGTVLVYAALMIPAESFYRGCYSNLYFWNSQQQYNSLADETYGKYGDAVFGKTIYILGNSYGVTDFYADTFFKVFDPARKAEGTEVRFVDSIRDFGQVTENMLVLREDPEFHGYQDVTELVREMKCEAVYGYYGDGWMDESARIRVMAGSTGRIQLQFYYPGVLTGKEVCAISVNGEPAQQLAVENSTVQTEIAVAPYSIAQLDFENNFYYKDALEQRGEKRFSMILEITAD